MAIYKIIENQICEVSPTTFVDQNIRERAQLQQMLKENIKVVSPDTLIVSEEFSDWDDSLRRIDLLGIDKQANLIVIELKRSDSGDHMELQALRYAAMISTMTFEKLVSTYKRYLSANNSEIDPYTHLLEFLGWQEADEEQFAQEVNLVLASAKFSKELTTSVAWLNDVYGMKIRCVRMQPYVDEGKVFLDVQTIIPLPELAEYQIRISEKNQRERISRENSRDFTRYDVTAGEVTFTSLPKRWVMLRLVQGIVDAGGTPQEVMSALPWRGQGLFKELDGELNSAEVEQSIEAEDSGGTVPLVTRYFTNDDEIFHFDGRTYALSNQWGGEPFRNSVDALLSTFPNAGLNVEVSDRPTN